MASEKESGVNEPLDLIRLSLDEHIYVSLDERIYVMLWSENELHSKL